MQTDAQRLLAFFRENPNREINAYVEIVGTEGLRILEYTGRTTDARKLIGCKCANFKRGNPNCKAGEHIINTRKGYYKYKTQVDRVATRLKQPIFEFREDRIMPQLTLPNDLAKLRVMYREARDRNDRMLMARITAKAHGLGANPRVPQKIENELVKNVQDTLL